MKNELFENIIGYKDIKKTLERIIDTLNNPKKYQKLGSSIPHGLLLYGPPGLGKTTFAYEMLENMKNRKSYILRKTKSDGDFLKEMNLIFNEAKKNQPSTILLDDIDKYSIDDNTSNNEEFVAVQSLIDTIKKEDIFIIATANNKFVLPRSLLRSGRFDIKIEITYPSEKESFEIIKHYLKNKKIEKDINLKNISYILECSSCADLEKVCNQAGIYAGFKNKNKIGMSELLRASLELQYDANIEEEPEDDKYALQVAYHEAGHALIGSLLEKGSVSFITIAKTNSKIRGITKYHNNDYYFDDIKFMKNRIITLLAGKAALEIIYNTCDTGCDSDISRAYTIAHRFVNDYCMLNFNSRIEFENNISEKVKQSKDEQINKLITDYYHKTKELLIENKSKLNALALALKDKKILFQDEIEKILKEN